MDFHPGAMLAVRRLSMTELDAARAVMSGELSSPHLFDNLALFALRITGTGAAYRIGLDEYVWREPAVYLNDEFLARCNGLPVVIYHPEEKDRLDTEEFRDRVVGAIMLPYVKGDEVWGIARINDMDAAKIMAANQLSTSPGVVFKASEVSNRLTMPNGSELLIEGTPSLLDHLAICERGVWDKGGEPAGVQSDTVARGDSDMTEEEMKAKKDAEEKACKDAEDKAKKDAESGEKLDKMLSSLDSVCGKFDAFEKRMDAMEKRMDSDMTSEVVSDKAKKDAEEKEAKEAEDKAKADAEKKEEEERADKARKDSELASVLAQIKDLGARIPPRLTEEQRSAMADAQARADSVYALHGKAAPRPMDGEDLIAYRRRLLSDMRPHSAQWKAVDLAQLGADALGVAETQIYADAERIGRCPPADALGGLREIKRRDQTGREISEFVGDAREVYNPSAPKQYFKQMVQPAQH